MSSCFNLWGNLYVYRYFHLQITVQVSVLATASKIDKDKMIVMYAMYSSNTMIVYIESILNANNVPTLMFQISFVKIKCQNVGEIMFHRHLV